MKGYAIHSLKDHRSRGNTVLRCQHTSFIENDLIICPPIAHATAELRRFQCCLERPGDVSRRKMEKIRYKLEMREENPVQSLYRIEGKIDKMLIASIDKILIASTNSVHSRDVL